MRTASLAVLTLLVATVTTAAQTPPQLADADRIRIAESFRLAEVLGNRVWPDWDKAPFAVLLVTPDHEFLLRHPKPTTDFKLIGDDDFLKCKVWYRKRTFRTDFLATFPAVGGVPTIVIGQPENTAVKKSTRWVITLLHEHFHQLQNSQPRYYVDVDSLGLARGDKTGMWMLNYAFPYARADVRNAFPPLCESLLAALQAKKPQEFNEKFAAYREARKKFLALLDADDRKYVAFQVWQEGIARHTELHVARMAAAEYEPSKEFQGLKDYTSFTDEAQAIRTGIEKQLASLQLDKAKREAFYPFGAAEGLLLDRAKPDWRKRYFADKFSLDAHFRADK